MIQFNSIHLCWGHNNNYTNTATQYKHKHANCIVFELSVIVLTPETFLMWKTAMLTHFGHLSAPEYING